MSHLLIIGWCSLVWEETFYILGSLKKLKYNITHRMLNRSYIIQVKRKLHGMNIFLKKLTVGTVSWLLCSGLWTQKLLRKATTFWTLLVYVMVPCSNLAPQVGAKRTNRPGISTTDRGFPRARFRSRGGSFSSRARYYSGYTPPRGRGRAFRWADTETPHFTVGEHCTRMHSISITGKGGQDKQESPSWPVRSSSWC